MSKRGASPQTPPHPSPISPWWDLLRDPGFRDLIRTAPGEQAKQTIMKTP